jgi:hypothetical protein
MQVDRVEAAMRAIYGARAWIVASDVLQGAGATVKRLRALGAERCLVIAARTGTGDLPDPAECDWHVLGLPPLPMMEAIHASEAALRDLPTDVQAAVDRFDPEQRAAVIGAIFSDGRPVGGRRFWGARPEPWRRLEDKTVVDALWDAAGVERSPSEVVDVTLEALTAAARRVDAGEGTVWAGDAAAGFHGGATYTCRVTDAREALGAFEHLSTRCGRARVMPFLDGIPCSIHGLVFPDHVLVLRPAELVTLRRPGARTGFLYARAATFWDPPPAERERMRAIARRVGEHLREAVGYRGAFTVDGVMSAQGFAPTELNPRVGAALGMMVPEVPFSLLHDALVEGAALDLDPVQLEDELVARADAVRCGRIGFVTEAPVEETVREDLVWKDGAWQRAAAGEAPDGELMVGPGPSGGFVNLTLSPERTPVGPPVGPKAAALVAYADGAHATRLGPVSAASERIR